MSSSDIAGYSHQVLCHYPPVLPLFIKPTVCFVLFHFSVIYLILLMALGCLSIWGCLRSTIPHLCIVALGKGHPRHNPTPGLLGAGLAVTSG